MILNFFSLILWGTPNYIVNSLTLVYYTYRVLQLPCTVILNFFSLIHWGTSNYIVNSLTRVYYTYLILQLPGLILTILLMVRPGCTITLLSEPEQRINLTYSELNIETKSVHDVQNVLYLDNWFILQMRFLKPMLHIAKYFIVCNITTLSWLNCKASYKILMTFKI